MKMPKFTLRQLFSNTKFVVIFSIVVAFIFWIVVALEYAPVIENEIKDIPVKIDMNNSVPDKLGLQIFGQSEFTINVTVKGNRYIVGGDLLTADDFDATAQTAYVDSAGKHSLLVKVTAKDVNADYEIVSKSADYIEVFFDKYAEKEIEVTPRIISDLEEYTPDDYLFDKSDIFYNVKTVKITGAQTEVSSVTAAYADIEIDRKMTETQTLDSKIVLSNGNDLDLKYVKINGESSLTVPVTLPVYKIENVSTGIAFKNAPSDYINQPIEYSISPQYVKVALLQNGSDTSENLTVGTIDFSEISPTNKSFSFDAANIKNAKMLDGTTSFYVELKTDGLSSTDFIIKSGSVSVTGSDTVTKNDVDISSIGSITVIGKQADLNAVTSDMISVSIDLTGLKLKSGENSVPCNVTLKNSKNCWINGAYTATVTIK